MRPGHRCILYASNTEIDAPVALRRMLSAILKMPHDGADSMSLICLGLICSVIGDGVVDVGAVEAADQDQGIPEVQLLHHVFPDLQCTCMHQDTTATRCASPFLVAGVPSDVKHEAAFFFQG